MTKLNQIIAIEKGTKQQAQKELTAIYHTLQKPNLFGGFTKTYEPKDEEGDRFPDESQRIQYHAEDLLARIAEQMTDLFDVTAAKDWGNTAARADVVIDGETILEGVPATYLLFLEKQFNDLKSEIEKLPELDPAHDWTMDENAGVFKSAAVKSGKTRKVAKPIVLYDATPEHPAQTQLIQIDETVGYWTTVRMSGAIRTPRKAQLRQRIRKLIDAVKFAREEANMTVIEKHDIAKPIFEYLLAE